MLRTRVLRASSMLHTSSFLLRANSVLHTSSFLLRASSLLHASTSLWWLRWLRWMWHCECRLFKLQYDRRLRSDYGEFGSG